MEKYFGTYQIKEIVLLAKLNIKRQQSKNMPKFEVLYYPNFEPPAAWCRSFLLFFDKIRTIVPEDVKYTISEDVSEINDIIPDALEPIPPENRDIAVDDLNLDRMRNAFEIIKEKEKKSKEVWTLIHNDGSLQYGGHVYLHDQKISDRVRSLLEEFEFISPLSKALAKEGLVAENFTVVDEDASNIIVSNVADKIASKHGWNTVTDHQIDFTVNSLNAFQWGSLEDPQSKLVSSIINCEIPQEIQNIDVEKYKEIRDAYSDVRKCFHRAVVELSSQHRLEKIGDKQILEERISEITQEFDSEIENFKNSEFGRKIKRWMPIGVGGLTTLTSLAFDEPEVKGVCGATSVAIRIIQERWNRRIQPKQSEVHRLIAGMQKDILKAPDVRSLV